MKVSHSAPAGEPPADADANDKFPSADLDHAHSPVPGSLIGGGCARASRCSRVAADMAKATAVKLMMITVATSIFMSLDASGRKIPVTRYSAKPATIIDSKSCRARTRTTTFVR